MHRNELQSQSRLAQLYKDSAEDAEKKCEELVSAVEELQAVIKANAEGSDIFDIACKFNNNNNDTFLWRSFLTESQTKSTWQNNEKREVTVKTIELNMHKYEVAMTNL